MKLFEKRSLSLILCIMLGGFTIYTRAGGALRSLPVIMIPLLLVAFVITLLIKRKKLILLICAVMLFISVLFSQIYFSLHFYAFEKYEDEVSVEGVIYKIDKSTGYSTKFLIKTDSINEKRAKHKFSAYILEKLDFNVVVAVCLDRIL